MCLELHLRKIDMLENNDETMEILCNALHSLGVVYYFLSDTDKALARFATARLL